LIVLQPHILVRHLRRQQQQLLLQLLSQGSSTPRAALLLTVLTIACCWSLLSHSNLKSFSHALVLSQTAQAASRSWLHSMAP
jgi:hypothetical protein